MRMRIGLWYGSQVGCRISPLEFLMTFKLTNLQYCNEFIIGNMFFFFELSDLCNLLETTKNIICSRWVVVSLFYINRRDETPCEFIFWERDLNMQFFFIHSHHDVKTLNLIQPKWINLRAWNTFLLSPWRFFFRNCVIHIICDTYATCFISCERFD